MAGKGFLGKVTSTLLRYPVCQKFRPNRSVSHIFRYKCVFAFYKEIQDSRPNWRETIFGKNRQ